MSKNYDPSWEDALTVVQEVQPPFIPDDAHAMTVVVAYPPGKCGCSAASAPERPVFRLHARGRDAVRAGGVGRLA